MGESMPESGSLAVPRCEDSTPHLEDNDSQQFQAAVRSTIRERQPISRKMHAPSPSPRAASPSPRVRTSSPLKLRPTSSSPQPGRSTTADKRSVSPLPTSSPLARSGSLSMKPALINSSDRRQYPSEPQKSASMRLHAERIDHKEMEHTRSKNKSFLKSLLTRRRSRKDDMLYSYLDEY
ncbi:protein ABIL3-like [Iris pallida]|uniref:Protein ABIL3-like n=1 Tax=Iris pallida TaxID=29817 RepID=A0AAX6GJ37_IRIPA|nr:protein ABIL3-like [Iris pallida]